MKIIFSEFFEEIKDTVPAIITEAIQDFERNVDLYYPFERFSLVEVPVQFYSYERILTGTREQVQPEMILYTEKGLLADEADFHGRMNRRRGFGRGDDENLTPEEKKIRVLQNFLATFTQEQGRPDFNRSQGELQIEEKQNLFYAFPLFYNYAYYIRSDQWPVADRVFEAYKKQATANPRMGFIRDLQGMSEDEQGNLALLSQSFEEILDDPEQRQIVDNVIKQKGKALFSIIKRKTEDEAFEDFLYTYLNDIQFSSSTIEDFNDAILDEFGIDLIPYMEDWFSSMELPAFLIGAVNAVNVLDGDQLKTMVKFKVSNTEDVEGIISVEFRLGGGGRFLMGRGGGSFGGTSADNIVKLIHLEGNQTKEVSFLLNGTPRGATINTLTSRNIPSEIRLPLDNIEEDKKAVPYEGEQVVDIPVRIAEDNEIIVDNEDMYFTVDGSEEKSLLWKLLISEEKTIGKYSGFSGISYIFLTPVDLFEMTRQLMFPVLFLGSMAFMFSTIIKNGNGTAVVMVILGVLMLILREPVERTMWNIFLNPFNVPRNMNEMIWEGIARNNRIFLVVGALVFILYGLFNLQKREKFI